MLKLMKYKNLLLSFSLILIISIFIGIAAASAAESENVRDYLTYLSDEEINDLQERINAFKDDNSLDLALVITDNTEGKSSMEFADDYFDYNGFGVGSDYSGLLMLINMDIREVWISTYGRAVDIFTDNRIDAVLDAVYPYLAADDFYNACVEFINQADQYAKLGIPKGQYRDESPTYVPGGSPISGSNSNDYYPYDRTPVSARTSYLKRAVALMSSPIVWIISLMVAAVATLIATHSHKGTVTISNRTYEEQNSFRLTKTIDEFIRETTTRVRINNDTGRSSHHSSSSHSNRSSVHQSSSGRSHGGGGRKF